VLGDIFLLVKTLDQRFREFGVILDQKKFHWAGWSASRPGAS
jgi:hypothetical protein